MVEVDIFTFWHLIGGSEVVRFVVNVIVVEDGIGTPHIERHGESAVGGTCSTSCLERLSWGRTMLCEHLIYY